MEGKCQAPNRHHGNNAQLANFGEGRVKQTWYGPNRNNSPASEKRATAQESAGRLDHRHFWRSRERWPLMVDNAPIDDPDS
jgi:hypothetical protein